MCDMVRVREEPLPQSLRTQHEDLLKGTILLSQWGLGREVFVSERFPDSCIRWCLNSHLTALPQKPAVGYQTCLLLARQAAQQHCALFPTLTGGVRPSASILSKIFCLLLACFTKLAYTPQLAMNSCKEKVTSAITVQNFSAYSWLASPSWHTHHSWQWTPARKKWRVQLLPSAREGVNCKCNLSEQESIEKITKAARTKQSGNVRY